MTHATRPPADDDDFDATTEPAQQAQARDADRDGGEVEADEAAGESQPGQSGEMRGPRGPRGRRRRGRGGRGRSGANAAAGEASPAGEANPAGEAAAGGEEPAAAAPARPLAPLVVGEGDELNPEGLAPAPLPRECRRSSPTPASARGATWRN